LFRMAEVLGDNQVTGSLVFILLYSSKLTNVNSALDKLCFVIFAGFV